MKYLLGLILLISVSATAQYSPTATKTRFVNGIGLGTKDTSTMNAADTAAMIVGRDSSVYFRYKGYWKPFAYAPSTGVGTVKSVGVSMPSAFTVTNSPITTSGTIAITGAGTASQYIRGDGQLATYSNGGGGGGSSVNYYLNGGTAASVSTYYQMSNTAVVGTGANFSTGTNGLIAQFLTDAGNPNSLTIPAGAWTFQLYFSASSAGGTPTYYVELYKYSVGGTFTLIASNSSSVDGITSGTATELYVSNLPVPATTLLATDRLAVRVYVATSGRTITMYTQDSHLCKITTTFSGGISALNGLTANTQYFATGTSGTDFAISSATDTHTFNLPTASATNRGALSSTNWSTFNGKIGPGDTASMLSPYALDYNVVHKNGNETVNGLKTFTSYLRTVTSGSTGLQAYNSDRGYFIGMITGSTDSLFVINYDSAYSIGKTRILQAKKTGEVSIPNLSTAGIVTNTSAGQLGTSNGTGFIKMSGGVVSYDNSTYLTTSSAASTYVPYTGATTNVNLGAYNLTATRVNVGGAVDNSQFALNVNSESNFSNSIHIKSAHQAIFYDATNTTYWQQYNSSNILTFAYNGSDKITFNTGGGITSPSEIVVKKNGSNSVGSGGYFSLINAASTDGWFHQLNASNGIDYWALVSGSFSKVYNITNTGVINTSSRLNINGATDDVNKVLQINGNLWATGTTQSYIAGNVGIGALTANYKLTTDGSGNAFMFAALSTNIGTVGNWVGYLYGYTGSTYQKGATIFESIDGNGRGKFHIALNNAANGSNVTISDAVATFLPSGNVGIGTTTPAFKLDVNGLTNLASRVMINGATDDGATALKVTGNGKFSGGVSIGTTTLDAGASLRVVGTYNGLQAVFGYVDGRGLAISTASNGTNEANSILDARGAGAGSLSLRTEGVDRLNINYLGAATFSSLAGTGSRIVVADASGTLSATTAAATSGTYTPTITLVSNAASSTARVCQYMRVGSVVTVSGYVTVTATTPAVSSRIYMTLPISSSFTSTAQAGGAGGVPGGANIGTVIFANSTATTVSMDFVPTAGALDYWFTYTYQIL